MIPFTPTRRSLPFMGTTAPTWNRHWGSAVVNAYGTEGGVNTRGQGSVNYKLNYIGSWIPDIIAR